MSEKDFTLDEIMKELRRDAMSSPSEQDPYELDQLLAEVHGYSENTTLHTKTQIQEPEKPVPEMTAEAEEEPSSEIPGEPFEKSAEEPDEEESEDESSVNGFTDRQLDFIQLKKERSKVVQDFELSRENLEAQEKIHMEQASRASYINLSSEVKSPDETEEPVQAESATENPAEESGEKSSDAEKKAPAHFSSMFEEDDDADLDFEKEIVEEYTDKSQASKIRAELAELAGKMKWKTALVAVAAFLSLIPAFCTEVLKNGSILDGNASPMAVLCIDLALLLFAGVGCFDLYSNGLVSLLRRHPNAYSSYSVAYSFTLLANVALLAFPDKLTETSVTLFAPLMLVCMIALPCGRYLAMKRICSNFDTMTAVEEPFAVELVTDEEKAKDFTSGKTDGEPVLIYNKKTPFLSHFIDESYSEDLSDRLPLRMLPGSAVVAVLVAAIAVFRHDGWFTAMSAFSLIFILGAGLVPLFLSNFPLLLASRSLSEKHAGVLGNNACETFEDGNAILLDAKDLFKGTDVTLYGIKTFLDGPPVDRVILDAASILSASNSILGDVFLNIVANREDYLSPVDDIKYEDGMGISAWVNERRILIGSRELMVNHSIQIPSNVFEENHPGDGKHLLYLSSSGALSAIFVIGLDCSEELRDMMDHLYSDHILSVVKTVDPMITEEVLGHAFHLPAGAFRIIPSHLHADVNVMSVSERPANAGVFNDGTMDSFIHSFLTAKDVNRSIHSGMLVYYITTLLIALLVVAFALMHSLSQVGNIMLCVYEILSLVICLIIQKLSAKF